MESPRHQARELVLKGLYAYESSEQEPDAAFDNIATGQKLAEKYKEFARTLFLEVVKNSAWADGDIDRLAANWDLSRLAVLDRNILRMAMVELEKMPDVPVKVVLNEAIELAKTFSTAESSAFVNGVLDHYVKDMEKPDTK
jgi:N utilization substance protein B